MATKVGCNKILKMAFNCPTLRTPCLTQRSWKYLL